MAVTINSGGRLSLGAWQSSESLTESTATVPQVIGVDTDITFLGMGTATGDNRNNLYTLTATSTEVGLIGDAREGQEKVLNATGTGEAAVFIETPTGRLPFDISAAMLDVGSTATDVNAFHASATGFYVFQADGDFCRLKFMNDLWHPLNAIGCTFSTGT